MMCALFEVCIVWCVLCLMCALCDVCFVLMCALFDDFIIWFHCLISLFGAIVCCVRCTI